MNAQSRQSLAPFKGLVGRWTMESARYPDFRGRASFEWIEDGAYLAVRDEVEAGDFPSGTWIIGADDAKDTATALYFDSRGVRRVYQTTLVDGVWRIWREAPGFSQRFTGALAEDGQAIIGQWETSADGSTWQKDFDLVYRKVG